VPFSGPRRKHHFSVVYGPLYSRRLTTDLYARLAYRNFIFSEGCACDICGRPRLPTPWLSSHGDYTPTAPSLRPLVPSGSLIKCQAVQVYHHHPSFLRAALWLSLFFSFQRGPTCPQYPVTYCNPLEDLTIRFSIYSSADFLKILPDVISFLRRSCRLAPLSFIHRCIAGPSVVISRASVLFRGSSCNIVSA
jgi:hypothetical protein